MDNIDATGQQASAAVARSLRGAGRASTVNLKTRAAAPRIYVDARGAERGVHNEIMAAMNRMEDRIVNRSVSAVVNGLSRGRF